VKPSEPSTQPPPATTLRRWSVAFLVAALLAAGVAFAVRGVQLREAADPGNTALTDAVATRQVTDEVSAALSKVFSYSPDTADLTEQAAAELLADRAAEQYRELFGQVREQVGAQRLTLSTDVVRVGVSELSHDTARLLVFLDQVTTRNGQAEPATAAAQLSVTAELHDGRWLITAITAR
jgi:Mce-associated membrane protein